MKKIGSLLLGFLLLALSHTTHAQTIKQGDVIYYKANRLSDGCYTQSPLYVIATVKKIIGSTATLSTDAYLYKCARNDRYWQITEQVRITKDCSAFGFRLLTWKAEDNQHYTQPVKDLKPYNAAVEKEITDGKITSSPKNCSITAH